MKKRQKFVELAEKRVDKALKDMRLIGNLSNKSAYEFTEEDIKKIFRAIQREVDAAKARFTDGSTEGATSFKL